MPDLTIGAIIALANKGPRNAWSASWSWREWECACGAVAGGVDNGPDELTCWNCDAPPPDPKIIGALAVTKVDHERKTITVSGA